ncbi:MAG: nucleotidyltransferase domain-containing protein [Planctomycetota bacterium]
MAPLIEQNRDALIALCKRYHVKTLEVFGSATTDRFDPQTSDIDLLVEFDLDQVDSALLTYVGFRDAAAELLGRPVDLASPDAIRNPYFRMGVDETRQPLYAA